MVSPVSALAPRIMPGSSHNTNASNSITQVFFMNITSSQYGFYTRLYIIFGDASIGKMVEVVGEGAIDRCVISPSVSGKYR